MGRQGNHLGLLVTVHVHAVVLFHALHELFHENPEFRSLDSSNVVEINAQQMWEGARAMNVGSALALGKMIQWEGAPVWSFAAFGGNAH
jgi:hypothetical protein